MKKLISALSAAVLAANALGTIANASFLYNEQAPRDNSYYCIVSLDDKPLSCYDYAKQFGTDQLYSLPRAKQHMISLRRITVRLSVKSTAF